MRFLRLFTLVFALFSIFSVPGEANCGLLFSNSKRIEVRNSERGFSVVAEGSSFRVFKDDAPFGEEVSVGAPIDSLVIVQLTHVDRLHRKRTTDVFVRSGDSLRRYHIEERGPTRLAGLVSIPHLVGIVPVRVHVQGVVNGLLAVSREEIVLFSVYESGMQKHASMELRENDKAVQVGMTGHCMRSGIPTVRVIGAEEGRDYTISQYEFREPDVAFQTFDLHFSPEISLE